MATITLDIRGSFLNEYGEVDSEAFEDYAGELTDLFLASPEGAGFDGFFASAMMQYAMDYEGVSPASMTSSVLSSIMFDLFPRKVSCRAEKAQACVDELRAFWLYVKREFSLENADGCLQLLEGKGTVSKLHARLSDRRLFGPAKSFVMAGMEAGYDMESREGIQAWQHAHNARLDNGSFDGPVGMADPFFTTGGGGTIGKARAATKNRRKMQKSSRRRNR